MLLDLLSILFPSPCHSCGYLSEALCKKCYSRLEFKPHVRNLDSLKVVSSMYYQSGTILERLIESFKYKHQANLFRVFVPYMIQSLRILLDEPGQLILVPVPLHAKKEKERGYNQASLLAKWVSRGTGSLKMDLLERVRETSVQAQLKTRKERLANMQGAFGLIRLPPKDSHVVLVDDIVTTGSTLLACRNVLEAAGVRRISALSLADREKKPTSSGN